MFTHTSKEAPTKKNESASLVVSVQVDDVTCKLVDDVTGKLVDDVS